MHSVRYVIPEFKSDQEAIKYANKAKWIEPLYQQFAEYEKTLRAEAYDSSKGWLGYGQKNFNNPWRDQWYRISLALKIMGNYKRQGIKGDSAQVGAYWMASSVPAYLDSR